MEPNEAIEAIKSNYPPENYSILREALDLSMELLDKKEKGLLIELPVPIGSDVWLVHKQDGYCTVSYVDMMIFPLDLIEEWGKTVFATREEAEKRLEELKNERL